jgi:hypothetical protein
MTVAESLTHHLGLVIICMESIEKVVNIHWYFGTLRFKSPVMHASLSYIEENK